MAIYHCSVKIIGRNAGRSSVAASAYRSGSKMTNQYDGVVSDYTKKRWIEHTEILLPEHAPEEYKNRENLWNAVELAEKSSDAQLAREVELALPVEMNLEQQKELMRTYVQEAFVNLGMCADIAIHNPPKMNDRHQPVDEQGYPTKHISEMQFCNPHAHVLLTMRPLDEHGKWEAKSQKEYLCVRDGVEKGFTSIEYQTAKQDGWEKQFKFYSPDNPKKKVWLSASEGERLNLERVDRNPKTTKYGRKNPMTEYWNQTERMEDWRKKWEDVVNAKFKEIQMDIQIDSRSFAERKIDKLPSLHMGVNAVNMEKKAERLILEGKPPDKIEHSDIADINRQIAEYNGLWSRLQELERSIEQKIRHICEQIKMLTQKITDNIRSITVKKAVLDRQAKQMENKFDRIQKERDGIQARNAASEKRIEELERQKGKALFGRKYDKMIEDEKARIEKRNDYYHNLIKSYGFTSEDEVEFCKKNSVAKVGTDADVNKLSRDTKSMEQELHKLINVLPEDKRIKLSQDKSKSVMEQLSRYR